MTKRTRRKERQLTSDKVALDVIARLLDGTEWNGADTLDAIAELLRDTGRKVRDPADVPTVKVNT